MVSMKKVIEKTCSRWIEKNNIPLDNSVT